MLLTSMKYRSLYLIYNVEENNFQIDWQVFLRVLKRGVYCVQYRSKGSSFEFDYRYARKVQKICCRSRTPFVINDSLKLARRVRADGIHIGQEDGKLSFIKKQLNWRARGFKGRLPIVGVSCYNHLALAIKGKKEGADYLAFGALFPSPTKPDKETVSFQVVKKANKLGLPTVVIGGINSLNLRYAKKTHANAYAMISGINGIDDKINF